MRNAFAKEITRLAAKDERVVLLSGDIGNRLFDDYKSQQSERFVNCGVAEQNMTGVAAGMAIMGMRPFTYTIAPFCTTRCLEQIKIDIAYHKLPVTIVSVGAGLSYAGLGPTHHSCEDISFLRSIPGMNVIAPADGWEVVASVRAVLQQNMPSYIRLGKKGEPNIHSGIPNDFEIGKGIILEHGHNIAIIATGTIVYEALIAVQLLKSAGLSCQLINMHTVKPLDYQLIEDTVQFFDHIFIVEEHSKIGGLGSAIAEFLLNKNTYDCQIHSLGTPDEFYKLSGSQHFARSKMGLNSEHIANFIKQVVDVRT